MRSAKADYSLEELGAPTAPEVVAAALVEGFRATLDVEFTSRLESTLTPNLTLGGPG